MENETLQYMGIDPGTTSSGVVIAEIGTDNFKVIGAMGKYENAMVLGHIHHEPVSIIHAFVCEFPAASYAQVGKEFLETCFFCGRIMGRCNDLMIPLYTYTPQQIRQIVCGSAKAKDAGVRQALIDQLGIVGTKKAPGPLYGVSSHAWRALACLQAYRLAPELATKRS